MKDKTYDLYKEYRTLEGSLGFYFGRLMAHPLIPPEHVYLSLTTRCNLSCKMCGVYKYPSSTDDELSLQEIKDVILQIKKMKIWHLIFSGGEPLLRKDFLAIAEFASWNIKEVDVITNGVLFDDELIQQIIKLQLNHVTFSLDGLKSTNDKIRGSGVFDVVKKNINRFNYYKTRKGSEFPTLGINYTVMGENIDDILPMITFARVNGVNAILFQPLLFNNLKMEERKINEMWPSEDKIAKLEQVIDTIIKLKIYLDNFVICSDDQLLRAMPAYFRGKLKEDEFKCYEAIKRVTVTCDGKLWSCMGQYGDLRKENLRNAWFSTEATEARKKIGACKEHCLQDCVFSPLDLSDNIGKFLQKLSNNLEKKEIAKKLLEKVIFYKKFVLTVLEDKNRQGDQRLALEKELNNLDSLYKKIKFVIDAK